MEVYELNVVAAGELLRVAVQHIADECNVRSIIIKGRAPAVYNLCPPRISADVDVLVLPGDVDVMRAALESRGWTERPYDDPDGIFPQHSIAFFHRQWPTDVDLHFCFPGFEAPAEDAFEALWTTREQVLEAACPVTITGLRETAVIAVIHAMRTPTEARAGLELAALGKSVPTRMSASEFIDTAGKLGALAAVRPFVEQHLGSEVVGWPKPTERWLLYTAPRASVSIRMQALLSAPLNRKPILLWHSLWPSRKALAATDLRALDASVTRLITMRLSRLFRGVSAMPAVLREAVAQRGSSRPAVGEHRKAQPRPESGKHAN